MRAIRGIEGDLRGQSGGVEDGDAGIRAYAIVLTFGPDSESVGFRCCQASYIPAERVTGVDQVPLLDICCLGTLNLVDFQLILLDG